jgi:hypothetical protein
MEGDMKVARGIIAAAAIAFAVPAHAAVGDPLKILYLYSQVFDGGFSATAVSCTSFSGVTETLQFVVRDTPGALKANPTINIASTATITAATRDIQAITEDLLLTTGALQGTLGVLATSVNIVCTATVLQTNTPNLGGVTLHGARFNPISGTQE